MKPSSYLLKHICFSTCQSRDEVKSLLKEASDKEAIGIAILVTGNLLGSFHSLNFFLQLFHLIFLTVLIVSPIIIILVRNVVATIQVCYTILIDDDTTL